MSELSTPDSKQEKEVSIKPHDLVRKEDVEKVLTLQKGAGVKLKSFTIDDFTNKGDNYACQVSRVKVQYTLNEEELETSFIVKLNPCRKTVGLTDMTQSMFLKETLCYKEVIPEFNKELENLSFARLSVPDFYHAVTKANEEVIYLEDMGPKGFRMSDRKKGLDKKHTYLIMEELARFHAASTLYLARDEFSDSNAANLPVFKDFMLDVFEKNPNMDLESYFGRFIDQSAAIADNFEGYEFVSNFLRSMKGNFATIFKEEMNFNPKFVVVCHGDCWNNNFLFRYDDDGSPTECCLVDLQIIKLGSIALDLNYMLYCSLDGNIRKPNMINFLTHYYCSFSSVLAKAGKPVPFKLEELREEFYNRNFFGLLMGMMLIPIVLVDHDNAPSLEDFKSSDPMKVMEEFQAALMEITIKSPLLAPRFFSMFEEMKESGLFDRTFTDSSNEGIKKIEGKDSDVTIKQTEFPVLSHNLVKREDVQTALINEKGPEAKLSSFQMKSFTKKGDNYACEVAIVDVSYKIANVMLKTSYVVKINPIRKEKGLADMGKIVFRKEILFYREVLPKLNQELVNNHQLPLKVPKYYHSVERANEEAIFLEDLTVLGFSMYDRRKGMDRAHTILVLQELGRFHAASVLYLPKVEHEHSDLSKLPVFSELFFDMLEQNPEMTMNEFYERGLKQYALIADKYEEDESVARHIREITNRTEEILRDQLKYSDNFRVICHGDCWNNNFLFKYDQFGAPVECRLVDFQIIRIGSPALDLNYMLYCSLDGNVRSSYLQDFLAHYYSMFASVMAEASRPMPFTCAKLGEEFVSKNYFGLLMSAILIPVILVDPSEANSFEDFEGKDMSETMKLFHDALFEKTLKSPLLGIRLLSIFKEMKKTGLFTGKYLPKRH